MKPIIPLNPATYRRHPIHGENRVWAETNCYSDVVIELLHALGLEPIAALPFTLAIDFEGDQWTFFKFADADLLELYGLDIQELAVWRPLAQHIADQVAAGRPVLVELDSCFLPDTAGTAYRLAHVKSTVAVNEIDLERRHLGYFHNQGYYVLEGQDFIDVLQLDGPVHERVLPPYVEYVKTLPDAPRPDTPALAELSLNVLKKHLARAPQRNPFNAFKARFNADLDWLMGADIDVFHSYSFATLRQFGACYELAATYLEWLTQLGLNRAPDSGAAFLQIAQGAKALQFQLARAMARKKPLELGALDDMARLWDQGMDALRRHHA